MTAIETTRAMIETMTFGAHAANFGPAAQDCDNRATAARWVLAYLTGATIYGSPVTLDEATRAADRAFRSEVPSDVAEALK